MRLYKLFTAYTVKPDVRIELDGLRRITMTNQEVCISWPEEGCLWVVLERRVGDLSLLRPSPPFSLSPDTVVVLQIEH